MKVTLYAQTSARNGPDPMCGSRCTQFQGVYLLPVAVSINQVHAWTCIVWPPPLALSGHVQARGGWVDFPRSEWAYHGLIYVFQHWIRTTQFQGNQPNWRERITSKTWIYFMGLHVLAFILIATTVFLSAGSAWDVFLHLGQHSEI